MSNARKLQTEIDRVMKKVDEGVELFDEIWEKVYSAEQQNQKEKYEMDLKKEIKKLQRHRDQIKTWIGSSEVKDKDALVEARKLIETKMEQFKICEKETKTKTYSKEGLAREEKLDPAEEAKLNTTSWVGDYIERLQQLVEEADFEIEKLSSGKGKKSNKHQIEELNEHILNHKYHISKLEGIIRLVNNDRLDVDPVDQLRDDLDYYLDSYKEEDYRLCYDQDNFYEALGLDELDVVNVDHVTQALSKKDKDETSTSSKGSKDKKSSKKSTVASVIPITIGRAIKSTGKVEKPKDKKDGVKEPEAVTPAKPKPAAVAPAQPNVIPAVARTPTPSSTPPSGPGPVTSMAAILKRESELEKERQAKLLREQQARAQAEQLRQQQEAAQRQQQEAQIRQQEALRQQQQQQLVAQQEALKQQQEAAAKQQQEVLRQKQEAAAKQQQEAKFHAQQHQQSVVEPKPQPLANIQIPPPSVQGAAIEPLITGLGGMAIGASAETRSDAISLPLGLTSATPGTGSVHSASSYLSALNESFMTAPAASENDRGRLYTPQNPYPTPPSYPLTPSSIFDNPAVFEKLGTDCLFFIFYYAQGTYQQYLAARELKKQSWRFHKKYMTWFQRHEEPKITTDEYEQGTYVYFDYEAGWCTRIKTDFRFEYSYLEDSLQ